MQEIFNNGIIKVEVNMGGEHFLTALMAPGIPTLRVGASDKGLQISSPNNSIFNPTCFGPVNGFLLARTVSVHNISHKTAPLLHDGTH